MATTVVYESKQVDVPSWVNSLATFRRWYESDEFPDQGRICWFDGDVWIDLTMEQLFAHVQVKTLVASILTVHCQNEHLGIVFGDGAFLVNAEADLAVIPDGMFISNESIAEDRVKFHAGAEEGHTQVVGSPDVVIEIVSKSSVEKDTVLLRRLYWEAGIREYWVIDARSEPVSFKIYRHGETGYSSVRPKDGWVPSRIFHKSFRFACKATDAPTKQFTFEMR